jgi:Fic family protein
MYHSQMVEDAITSRQLDAAYRPFPQFADWLVRTNLDTSRWDRYVAALQNSSRAGEGVFARAREVAKRAAAIDTGAIENLYEVDRGFTYTVAFQTAAWEVALSAKGANVRSLFESQLKAYDYILDLATRAEPISEAAIRALHVEMCRGQETYEVVTSIGVQEHALPKGEYKISPNHVRTRTGGTHSYASVDVTPAEMRRLVEQMRTKTFLDAHPILQASYAHYGLVAIHPFADGNGRVARALAAAFTYRSAQIPIVILVEHKRDYFNSLEHADEGNFGAFVDFLYARIVDTLLLVQQSMELARVPAAADAVAAVQKLYVTRGGFTHEQVDTAGLKLIDLIVGEFQRQFAPFDVAPISTNAEHDALAYKPLSRAHRTPIEGGHFIKVHVSSAQPAGAAVIRQYVLELPRDAESEDDVILRRHDRRNSSEIFTARLDELLPAVSGILQIRISIFVERVVAESLQELANLAEQALNGQRP